MPDQLAEPIPKAPQGRPRFVLRSCVHHQTRKKRTLGKESYIFHVNILIFMNFGVSSGGFGVGSGRDAMDEFCGVVGEDVGNRALRRDITPEDVCEAFISFGSLPRLNDSTCPVRCCVPEASTAMTSLLLAIAIGAACKTT